MKYETVIRNIELSKTATIAQVEEVVDELLKDDEEYQTQNWDRLYSLLELFQKAEKYNGSQEQFHNFAVSLARADQYDLACDILIKGLDIFPRSMDLLADFLTYAIKCNRINEADEYYNRLLEIDISTWNWRAFDFSIDYLMAKLLYEQGVAQREMLNKKIDDLLRQFKRYHENDDRAYFAEYTVASQRNGETEAILKLKKFVDEGSSVAARCTMKVAEYYFNNGQYEIAESYIKKCKTDVIATDFSIEPGYVYMLSAFCSMCRLYSDGIDTLEPEQLRLRVKNIYKDCEATSSIHLRRRFSGYENLEVQREVLEKLTGISYYD